MQEGRSGVKKTSLAYIKVQPVIELLLFTELQNLRFWRKYGLSKFGGVAHSHTKYRGIKWPKSAIFDQYFQKYLSLSVQTCLKVRFYQVLHVSVILISRNVEILKIWAINGKTANFSQKHDFLKITQLLISGTEMMLGSWNLDQRYLYIVSKKGSKRFLNFWFFSEILPFFFQNGRF